MAPPLPLPCMAGTLALSFTSAQAEPPPLQQPQLQQPQQSEPQGDAVPKPPALPEVPSDDPSTPSSTDTVEAGPETTGTPTGTTGTPPPPIAEPGPEPEPAPKTTPSAHDPFAVELPPGLHGTGLHGTTKRRPPLLGKTDKRFYFGLFAGGSRRLRGGYSYFPGTDFKSELVFGGYGKNNDRVSGAAVIQVGAGFPFNTFTVAPRVQFNRPLLPDYAIYMTTTLTLGYRATSYSGYGVFQGLAEAYSHAVVGAVGWGASSIIAERLLLSFRPLNLELAVPAPSIVEFNWDVLGGLGVVW